MPTTNVCPYLPGQTVNTLEIPVEQSSRIRSASTNCLDVYDFKTMNPKDKFSALKPPTLVPDSFGARVGTSPTPRALHRKRSSRSLSPTPNWAVATRRFLGMKPSSRGSDRDWSSESGDRDDARSTVSSRAEDTRSTTPSDGGRLRDLSPESLRRFLSDEALVDALVAEQDLKLSIPDDIVEEIEDDDNFATSATSESIPFTTLSPPPFQRAASSLAMKGPRNDSTLTIVPPVHGNNKQTPPVDPALTSPLSRFTLEIPQPGYSFSAASSNVTSPTSPQSTASQDNSNHSVFDESAEDDEDPFTTHEQDYFTVPQSKGQQERKASLHQPFPAYSLPPSTTDNPKDLATQQEAKVLGSPALAARGANDLPLSSSTLLSLPGIDTGLGDLLNEISWIAEVV
jgi:hypothetical protein